MLEFIEQAIKLLVDKPDEVNIEIVETEQRLIYELTVGEGDYGKVIGKGGRNISALRTSVTESTPSNLNRRLFPIPVTISRRTSSDVSGENPNMSFFSSM